MAMVLPSCLRSGRSAYLGVGISLGLLWGNALPSFAHHLGSTKAHHADPTIAQATNSNVQTKLIARAESFIDLLEQGNYQGAKDYLSPELHPYLTLTAIRKAWEEDLQGMSGKYEKVLSRKVVNVVNANVVILNIQFAQRAEDVLFTFDDQANIIAVDWSTGRSVDQVVTKFFEALKQRDYAKTRSLFSPLLKIEITPQQVQQAWAKLEEANGPYMRLVDVDIKPGTTLAAPDLAIATLQFADKTEEIFLFFDDTRRIMNIDFLESEN